MTLEMRNLSKSFRNRLGHAVTVLDDVSLSIARGEALGLVGESGSGKTTLIRCAMRLMRPDGGFVIYEGSDVMQAEGPRLAQFRQEVQLVFQDPYASLNPRMTVGTLIEEGIVVHEPDRSKSQRNERVAELMMLVGLDPADRHRYPRSFSGGQRQRIAIARALAVRPRILVCDEPVSALDVSVQAQVINLLQDMQTTLGLGILFVSHDLAVVRHLCQHIAVLEKGKIVEEGDTEEVFAHPRHEYTRALLDAVPIGRRAAGEGLTARGFNAKKGP